MTDIPVRDLKPGMRLQSGHGEWPHSVFSVKTHDTLPNPADWWTCVTVRHADGDLTSTTYQPDYPENVLDEIPCHTCGTPFDYRASGASAREIHGCGQYGDWVDLCEQCAPASTPQMQVVPAAMRGEIAPAAIGPDEGAFVFRAGRGHRGGPASIILVCRRCTPRGYSDYVARWFSRVPAQKALDAMAEHERDHHTTA